ncbi:hypothetical protein ACP70R_037381 [Stipagrostis hirtigluma subsp. patula]
MIPYATAAEAEAALGRASMSQAEAAWFHYSATMPDHWLFCHISFVLLLVYTLVPLPLLLLEKFAPAVVLPYKLQPLVRIPPAASLRCYRDAACIFLFSIGPLRLVYPAVVKVMEIRMGLPLPSAGEIVAQLVVYSVVEDYLNYWIHRLLHTKWGHDKIHRVHHEFTAPVGYAMSYSHWAENIILAIPALAGPTIVPCHIIVHWLWFSIRLILGIDTHNGYNFPFSPTKLIPFYGGAKHHDFHHYTGGYTHSNFAPLFTYCDYIYMTNKGYRYHKASQAKLKKLGENNMEQGGGNAFYGGKED